MSKKTIVYVITSFGFTWLLWIPLLLNRQFTLEIATFPGQFYAASFGPLVGAITASLYSGGRKEIVTWWKRTYRFRIPLKWYVLAIGMPLVYFVVGVLIQRFITGAWIDWSQFGLTAKLPGFNVWETLLVWIFTFGLGEESGWRGFLLPELTRRFSLKTSSLLVAGFWMVWHLPAFWFNETYMQMGFGIIGWAISLMYGSMLLAWLSSRSKFSVIPVLLWHAGFDLLTASDQAADVMAMVCSMIVIIQGVWVARRFSKKNGD